MLFAPITLHCGVSSPERNEAPYPERYRVPAATARLVNAVRWWDGRVIAVGTTVVRALETLADRTGTVGDGEGETNLVVTPERGVRVVDGLITGWHEPEASHLQMLEAIAGEELLRNSYARRARPRVSLARVRRPAPDPALAATASRSSSGSSRPRRPG